MRWDEYPDRFWHCYVSLPGQKRDRERAVLNDAGKDEIRRNIVEPWHRNVPFAVSGTIVKSRESVAEIRIVQTEYPQHFYADRHNARMRDAGIADMATDRRLLPLDQGTDYTNELLFAETAAQAPSPDIGALLRVCERLPDAARALAARARGKPALSINDESDAQDLLHAVIRAYFKYSVTEEPMGKVAGGQAGRADLAIEDLGVIIEVKYVRGQKDQNRIVQEFAHDLLLYSKWASLQIFIYLVVNSRDLRDPEALEKLSGDQTIAGKNYRTYVVLA